MAAPSPDDAPDLPIDKEPIVAALLNPATTDVLLSNLAIELDEVVKAAMSEAARLNGPRSTVFGVATFQADLAHLGRETGKLLAQFARYRGFADYYDHCVQLGCNPWSGDTARELMGYLIRLSPPASLSITLREAMDRLRMQPPPKRPPPVRSRNSGTPWGSSWREFRCGATEHSTKYRRTSAPIGQKKRSTRGGA